MVAPALPPTQLRLANQLVSARHDYSALQLNLLFFLLSRLGRQPPPDRQYQFSLSELKQATGRGYNTSLLPQQLAAMQASCWQVGSPAAPQALHLFERAAYQRGQGVLEFCLSEASLPFLFNLHGNFTSFNLATALALRGQYAKRVYLLCERWRDQSATQFYQLDYLRWLFALTDPTTAGTAAGYVLFGHLRSRVLAPALRDLRKQSGPTYRLETKKLGRKVTSIRFLLTAESQVVAKPVALPLPEAAEQQKRARGILTRLQIEAPQLVQRIMSSSELVTQVLLFSHQIQAGKLPFVRDPAAYLLTRLGLVKSTKATKSAKSASKPPPRPGSR